MEGKDAVSLLSSWGSRSWIIVGLHVGWALVDPGGTVLDQDVMRSFRGRLRTERLVSRRGVLPVRHFGL